MDSKEGRQARKAERKRIRDAREQRRAERTGGLEAATNPEEMKSIPGGNELAAERLRTSLATGRRGKKNIEETTSDLGGNGTAAEKLRASLAARHRTKAGSHVEDEGIASPLGPTSIQEDGRRERIAGVTGDVSLAKHIEKRARRFGEFGSDEDDIAAEKWVDELNGNFSEKKRQRLEEQRRNEARKAEVRLHRQEEQLTSAHESCRYCLSNLHKFQAKHTVIAMGDHAYIALVHGMPLISDDHVYIAPIHHQTSSAGLDEGVEVEVTRFKQSVTKTFFASDQREAIFMETSLDPQRQRRHLVIECVPVSRRDASAAPTFFRQALVENAEEWSENGRILDVPIGKGISRTVPVNFAYFYVQFGLSGGFCQVLEREPPLARAWLFGHEVIASILGNSPPNARQWSRPSLNYDLDRLRSFLPRFERFDWTAALE